MLKIKKDDMVQVMVGKDKGKSGKVLKVLPKVDRVIIEKINVMKKTLKKSEEHPNGGFAEVERPIHVSNVMLIDKKTSKPTRFSVKDEKGKKVRISKKSGEVI